MVEVYYIAETLVYRGLGVESVHDSVGLAYKLGEAIS